MKIILHVLIILFSYSISINAISYGHEIEMDEMSIKHPMIPIFNSKMKTAAGYFTIVNKKNEADELLMVKTDFANAMMHKSQIDNNGIAKMEHVNKVIIPANSSVVFEQGSLHIMFTELKEPLEEYIDQKVTLVFKKLGNIEIDFQVERATTKMPKHEDH